MFKKSFQQIVSKRNDKRKRRKEEFVESNFLHNFAPNHTFLYVFGAMRVNIQKNKVIGPTTTKQNIYSFISIVAMTFASALHMTRYYQKFGGRDWLVLTTSDLSCIVQYSVFMSVRLIGKYTNKEKNIRIYYMLQNIDRILHVENNRYYSNFVFTVLMIVCILMLTCFTAGYIVHSYFLIQALDTFLSMPFCFGMLACHFDITLCVAMILFLIIRVRHLNQYIKVTAFDDHYDGRDIKTRSIYRFIMSLIIPNVVLNDRILQQEKWLECLKLIINSYRVIVDVYSISILMNTIIVLVWSFVCIGIAVSGAQSGIFPQICSILYIVWAIVYYVFLTAAAIYNDWFLGEIKRLKLTCVRIMASGDTGQFYKTASEMFRAIHYAKLEFDVYGVFVFTSLIPVQLMSVVTSNMLVLVQFIIEREI